MTNKQHRQKRQELIHRLGQLEETHCNVCPIRPTAAHNPASVCGNCSIHNRLRTIGDELEKMSIARRIEDLPEDLNASTYLYLKEMEWKQEDIRKHFGFTSREFYYFLSANGLRDRYAIKKNKEIPKLERSEDEKMLEIKDEIEVKMDKPQLQETVSTYFETRSQKSDELKAKATTAEESLDTDQSKIIKMQFEIERLERESQLWKDRQQETQSKLMELSAEYRKLDTDFRNESYENKRLKEMLEKMKETGVINVWLMKQHIGFMEQLALVTGQEEVGEFAWR